jgi:hypothetical protein
MLHHAGVQVDLFPAPPNDWDYWSPAAILAHKAWHLELAEVPSAWDTTTGSNQVKLGVIDGSFDVGHADLSPNLAGCVDQEAMNVVPCGNVSQFMAECDACAVEPQTAHGTHVAGLIAARGNNTLPAGVGNTSGVMWNASLYAAKYGATVPLQELDVRASTLANVGVRAINMSLGMKWWNAEEGTWKCLEDSESPDLYCLAGPPSMADPAVSELVESFDAVWENWLESHEGVLLVVSAGNEGHVGVESRFGLVAKGVLDPVLQKRVLVVASVGDSADDVSPGSCFEGPVYGKYRDRLAAPGGWWGDGKLKYVLGLAPGNSTTEEGMCGTSMAAPLVAGTAGLMLSVNPGLAPDELHDLILSTAKPIKNPFHGYAYRLLDSAQAVDEAKKCLTQEFNPESGLCDLCTPSCTNKECGPDGCGEQCPNKCQADEYCNEATGQCVAEPCVGSCQNVVCGYDKCGKQCPSQCPADTNCDYAAGQCKPKIPVCSNKCSYVGQVECAPGTNGWHKCYEDANKCRYWGTTTSCSPATCSGGKCGPPCTNPCTKLDATDCTGSTTYKECQSIYNCLNWSSVQSCPAGFVCDAGTDKCTCPAPDWWKVPLQTLYSLGIITNQYLSFDCSKTYNRAEWAKIVGAALKIEGTPAYKNCSCPYLDVVEGVWYADYVAALSRLDYGDGIPVFDPGQSLFNPGDKLDRCAAAKVVVEGWNVPKVSASLKYTDIAKIPAWCLPYVKAGVTAGILDNTGEFRPGDTATAGETAVMVSKAIEKYGQATPKPADYNHSSCSGQVACTNKCTSPGLAGCQDGLVVFCDDFDADGCNEWGGAQSCPDGTECVGGKCTGSCVPACAGKKCGTDGCGGTCGTCGAGYSCVAGSCTANVQLVPGKITSPPNGATVSNQEFTVTWEPGYDDGGKSTGTALMCKVGGGAWEIKVGFGGLVSHVFQGLAPGSTYSCKLRTRLNSDYDTWIDSQVYLWIVSSNVAAMKVVSVTPVLEPGAPACEDFTADAMIKNVGSQLGTWRASAYLHPAGAGIDSPQSEKAIGEFNVSLGPGAQETFTFKFYHDKQLPLTPATLEVTAMVEDAFDGYGQPSSASAPVFGKDNGPPVVSELQVFGYDGQPVQVLVGTTHSVKVIATDDYLITSWDLSYKFPGGTWQPIPTATPADTECLYVYGDWAKWTIPGDIPAGTLVDVRFRVWDLAGNKAEKTVQAKTIASGVSQVTFIKPVGGEKYEQNDNKNGSCVPVELAIVASPDVQKMTVGFTNKSHSNHTAKASVNSIPAGGHWEKCIDADHPGDDLYVYARLDDKYGQETFFYSPAVKVDFSKPIAPWLPVVAEKTQFPAPLPGQGTSESSWTQYFAMSTDGSKLFVHRQDVQAWTKSGTSFNQFSLKKLTFSLPALELQSTATVLAPFTEPDETPGAGDSLSVGRRDDLFFSFLVPAVGQCSDPFNTPCTYATKLRTIEGGAATPWQTLQQYSGLLLWDKPTLEPVKAGIQDLGALGKFALIQDSKNGVNELWSRTSGAWAKLTQYSYTNVWTAKSGSKLWTVRWQGSGPGATVVALEIDKSNGQVSSQTTVLAPTPQAADMMDYLVTEDLYTDSVFVAGWEWNTLVMHLATWNGGKWTTHPSVQFPATWRGHAVKGYYRQWMMAAHDILYFEFQVAYQGGASSILLAIEPGQDPDIENAIREVDSDKFRTREIIATPDGRLVRTVDYCNWNMEDRLCFQLSLPVLGASDCWDTDPCTEDNWDPTTGQCSHDPVVCQQGSDLCAGTYACDPATGKCVNQDPDGVDCDDGLFCNGVEACDPKTGACVDGPPPALSDGLTCTKDFCGEEADVIVHTPGNDACVSDKCTASYCEPDDPEKDPVTGCVTLAMPAEPDGLDCTQDLCDPETGQATHPLAAGFCMIDGTCVVDGEPHPSEPCVACVSSQDTADWSSAPDGAACDDGSWCTADDHCKAGACEGGALADCSWLDDVCIEGQCDLGLEQCTAAPMPEGTPCGEPGSCKDGLLTLANMCNGTGACVDAQGTTLSCAPYTKCASDTECATSCMSEADCVEGSKCLGGKCLVNQVPVADAGEDQSVHPGDIVSLDGSASHDPDGGDLAFQWKQTDGPEVSLDDPYGVTPTFEAPPCTTLTELAFELQVSDGLEDGIPDTVVVSVVPLANLPPVADAGDPQTANSGETVNLDGTKSFDPEGMSLQYHWYQTSGPAVELDDDHSPTPSFVAPPVEDDTFVEVALMVNDGTWDSPADDVVILVKTSGSPPDSGEETMPDVRAGDGSALGTELTPQPPDGAAQDAAPDGPAGDVGSFDHPVSVADEGCSSGAGAGDTAGTVILVALLLVLLALVRRVRLVPGD